MKKDEGLKLVIGRDDEAGALYLKEFDCDMNPMEIWQFLDRMRTKIDTGSHISAMWSGYNDCKDKDCTKALKYYKKKIKAKVNTQEWWGKYWNLWFKPTNLKKAKKRREL